MKKQAIKYGVLHSQPVASELPIRGALAVTAACFAQYLAAPVDLIRTRQAASKGSMSQTPTISSVARQVVAADGPRGLFSGASALMGRAASFNLGQLLTYDHMKSIVCAKFNLKPGDFLAHFCAASAAGAAATTASAPFENAKTYSQLNGKAPISHAIKMIYTQAGVSGFFRGWTPLYLKVAPHTMIVFVTLEQLRKLDSIFTNVDPIFRD